MLNLKSFKHYFQINIPVKFSTNAFFLFAGKEIANKVNKISEGTK